MSELRIDPEPWLPSGILSELNAAPPNPLLEINTKDPTNIPINHVQSSNSTQGSNFKFGEWNAKSKCIHVYPPKDTKQPLGAVRDNVHLPTTVMHFVGQPVISVTIVITFPFENVMKEDMVVQATKTDITIAAKCYDLLQVPLLFCVLPESVQVMFNQNDKVLTLGLPVLPYSKAFENVID